MAVRHRFHQPLSTTGLEDESRQHEDDEMVDEGQSLLDKNENHSGPQKTSSICLTGVLLAFTLLCVQYFMDLEFRSYGIDASVVQNSSTQSKAIDSRGYAVVINTYKRPDMLRQAIHHYGGRCGLKHGVRQIFIVWAESDEPPSPDEFLSEPHNNIRGVPTEKLENKQISLEFLRVRDSLNSRFLPIPTLIGEAVFMVDDDIQISCSALEESFHAWVAYPDSLVGFYPRHHREVMKRNIKSIIYHTWVTVFFQQKFSMILTKACFLHKKYLSLYSDQSVHPKSIIDYVDARFNCEDIAMALLVSNMTKPNDSVGHIYTEGHVKDLGLFGGISSGSGHFTSRTECLTDIAKVYEDHGWGFPLYSIPLRRYSWTRHFPGFPWQMRPSGIFEWFPSADTFQGIFTP